MIKVYLKQAWELLKQNKLFSMLYIVGTGLAIAMTMIMAVVYYVKIAPVYPEANRMNTLYLSNSKFTQGSGNNTRTMQWAVSYKALQDWFYPVENALVVSAELHNGISEDAQKHIFERFYKEDSFTQGAGLGLSICQTIVDRLHGSISVSSELGKGTRFEVVIPDANE